MCVVESAERLLTLTWSHHCDCGSFHVRTHHVIMCMMQYGGSSLRFAACLVQNSLGFFNNRLTEN